jgi:actin-related protein 3
MEPPVCVIDNGTGYTKMGYAGNVEPQYIIPSAIAMRLPNRNCASNAMIKTVDCFIGDQAEEKKIKDPQNYDYKKLLKSGQIESWEGIERFWHQAINQYLRCEPSEHRFILTEPPMNSPENREQMAEIMFETFGAKGLFIGV